VACAVRQTINHDVAAEPGRGALRVADRPAASLIAELEQRAALIVRNLVDLLPRLGADREKNLQRPGAAGRTNP